jgi:hypothetical protein
MGEVDTHHNETTEEEDVCPICLGEFNEDEESSEIFCGHLFHVDCIDIWLNDHFTCPLCCEIGPFTINLRYLSVDTIKLNKIRKVNIENIKKEIKKIMGTKSYHYVPIELEDKHMLLNGIQLKMPTIHSVYCIENCICIIHQMIGDPNMFVRHIMCCDKDAKVMAVFKKIQNNCEKLQREQ